MWYLLASSLLILQFNKKLSIALLMTTIVVAACSQTIDRDAVIFLTFLGVVAYVYHKFNDRKLRIIFEVLLLLTSFVLMLHLVPGFNNLRVLDGVRMGPESTPLTMYYNFDKALVPFILFICLKSLFTTDACQLARPLYWVILIASVPVLLIVAVASGGLKVELHHPEWLLQFVLGNLFFVSLAEEALFRGYLQQRLSSMMHPLVALVIASLLFGGLHYAGGILMVIFASLAGLIYGLAWMLSGRLWVAVFFHFGLNLFHLLFFTYPSLQRLPYTS